MKTEKIYLLDYGGGNVRSIVNAVRKLGYSMETVKSADDIVKADKLIFPGVGSFSGAMEGLRSRGFVEPLKAYLVAGRPYMGICVGLQALCLGSEESAGVEGLGMIPATIKKFSSVEKTVPHMGWNEASIVKCSETKIVNHNELVTYYFVHSFALMYESNLEDFAYTLTTYGSDTFISAVFYKNMFCTQFHPEKSGFRGLKVIESFLNGDATRMAATIQNAKIEIPRDRFTKRIIACLDVRSNDQGDLVVTKGDQYDVRETSGDVRNLGKPVELAQRYFEEGADEIAFLNITSFRNCPLKDAPLLEMLKKTSETVFVPLTIGGGIRDIVDPNGEKHSALEVAGEYFRSGADKVSIGSDAVYAAEEYCSNGKCLTGKTSIEQISKNYGAQAVVISVDPKRIYVKDAKETTHNVIETKYAGPNGERYCWYQCTVKGGREGRDLDVIQLATSCASMGAGEILLNCMDRDGTKSGFDLELISAVKKVVSIPVIASSGAGCEDHFVQVFQQTDADAALAAGIFHRKEVEIVNVKAALKENGIDVREHSGK